MAQADSLWHRFAHTVPGVRRGGMGDSMLGAIGDQPLVVIPGIPRPVSAPVEDGSSFYVREIPIGLEGTWETMKVMAEMAVEASKQPTIVAEARRIVRECGSKDYVCEYSKIMAWVKGVMDYRHDGSLQEMQQSPGWSLYVDGAGDCNNLSCLIASLDMAIGAKGVKFRAVALDKDNPAEMSHIYPMVAVPTSGGFKWMAQDTVPSPLRPLGWEPDPSLYAMDPLDFPILDPGGDASKL